MIRIKVTDEMVQAAMETDDAPTWRDEARASIEAALAIVERELNSATPVTWFGKPVIDPAMLSEGTCIEVTQ